MKVLDVQPFHEGLQRNIETLERIDKQINSIEQITAQLVSLEEVFKGEGGNALLDFYREYHLPLLKFVGSFINHFSTCIKKISHALNAFEPHNKGYIHQGFIEGDVIAGLKHILHISENLTDESNAIMDKVSDIVSLPHLDDTEVMQGVQRARRHSNDTVEALYEFDRSQTVLLSAVSSNLDTIEQWISEIESIMAEDLSKADFQVGNLSNMIGNKVPLSYFTGMNSSLGEHLVRNRSVYGQLLYPMGIAGVNASPVSASHAEQRLKAVNTDDVIRQTEGNEDLVELLKNAGDGALDLGKNIIDFFVLDDLKTLVDPEATGGEKVLSGFSLLPAGKLLKGAKLGDELLGIGKAVDESGDMLKKTPDYANYNPVEYKGTTKVNGEVKDISRRVYQRKDIDFTFIDPDTGLTNLELMKKGKPPYWKDGTKVELHHTIQLEPGPIVELPASLHDEYSKILHGLVENGGSFRNNPALEKQYNNFRRKYWRWRAEDIKE